MKFRVGDKVKVVDGVFKGHTGVIDILDEKDCELPYHVICSPHCQIWAGEGKLELITDDIEEKSSMKTFNYGSANITALSELKHGDCFQMLEGDYKGQYGMVCKCVDKDDYLPIVIFSELESHPIIKSVSWALKVKKVMCEVTFKEE